ncbi:alpha/beta fold hydrolase [Evansella cellulosilytica]|uniref:Alpha/beta hydrolase fold protein n=1 Tax=Evansella cellulosilytica (strain ATCC 21833 / DSM 2522 / FERM P-1141 / JCM 9156 / N-4) TaxID=649639 RepID=E6U0D6_EVAC2|nr:alpha/beta hydrolase [Evansella cellulosilytica]ADU30252.1 alpha/beta hydrolase fold protein [Evansella cellulosilytica DSM 2522]
MSKIYLNNEYINIANVNIYCEYKLNNKPPLLLLHGFVSSTYTFNKLIPLLSEHFSIIAIDLPGFGKSEKSKSFVYSFESYASLVVECMKHFEINKVSIVGHSMGGQIALYIAKSNPELIDTLILLCSSGYRARAKKILIYCSYLPLFTYIAKKWIQQKDIQKTLETVFYNKSHIHEELIKEFSRPLQEKAFYCSLVRLLRHREGDLHSFDLRKIHIPTLLLWGENDRVVPVHVGEKLKDDLPNAKLVTYKETGHLITEERVKEVFKEITAYLKT